MNFGKRLQKVRLERQLTQQAIAAALKVEVRTYQRYEEGSREPSFATLVALANILNVTTDYLLGRDQQE